MKHSEIWRFSELDDEMRLFFASYVAAQARAGTLHLIPGTNEPRPRVLGWSYYPEGLLVETAGPHQPRAQFVVLDEDTDGLRRVASMLRTEFCGGVVGCC
jgi:hypothetical protein